LLLNNLEIKPSKLAKSPYESQSLINPKIFILLKPVECSPVRGDIPWKNVN